MEIEGKAVHVGETIEISEKFAKRLLVLEVRDGEYANLHGVEFVNDRCSLLDGVQEGVTVKAHINLGRCREYQGKWYADHHRGWKIEAEHDQRPPARQEAAEQRQTPPEDEVPF